MIERDAYYRRHLPHYQPEGENYHVVFRLAGSIPAAVIQELKEEREREEKRMMLIQGKGERQLQQREHRFQYFERFERLLDADNRGPFWLKKPEIAEIVGEAIRFYDGKKIELIAHTIMPNHVHMVFRLLGSNRIAASGQRDGRSPFVRRISDPTKLRRDGVPSYRDSDPTEAGRDGVPSYKVTAILASIKKYTALRANRILKRRGAFWQHESYDHVIRDEEELEHTVYYVLDNPVKAGLCRNWRDWKWSYLRKTFIEE